MTIEMIEPEAAQVVQQATLPAVQPTHQVQTQPARQLSAVEYAMQNGATAADIRELVAMQIQMDNHKLAMLKQQDERDREQRKAEAELAFRRDFAAFRGENIVIPKTKQVDQKKRDGGQGPKFMQSEFDVVCSMLSPAMSRHGFSFRHDQKFGTREWPTPENQRNLIGWVTVTCYLEHRDGHKETLTLEGPPDESGAKNPLQEMQSTASYLKRQSLLAITGTATGGEDDENRMRGKQKDDPTPEDEAEISRLVDAGNAEAEKGSKPLTAWWGGLSEAQRDMLQPYFGGMRAAARKVEGGSK